MLYGKGIKQTDFNTLKSGNLVLRMGNVHYILSVRGNIWQAEWMKTDLINLLWNGILMSEIWKFIVLGFGYSNEWMTFVKWIKR